MKRLPSSSNASNGSSSPCRAQASGAGSGFGATNPDVTVVIPTRASASTLGRCLASVRASRLHVERIVVDNDSMDGTDRIAQAAGARYVRVGPERSAQRNHGLVRASAPVVAFIDSDQYVAEGLLEEACGLVERGADAVILTERSAGEGYWAAVRAWERTCYEGADDIEACRVFRTDFVRELGGFDEELSAFEDWDLTARARKAGAVVARTERVVWHDEGDLTLRNALAKVRYYGGWESRYRSKHPDLAARQLSPVRRMGRFLRHAPRLLSRPHLAVGVVVLKSVEYLASRVR